jgi:glycine/D-amino acid oxidase-like deaminating enzyme
MGGEQPGQLEFIREAVCFRPVTPSGHPIVVRLPDHRLGLKTAEHKNRGVWVSAGHGPWGIALSLGTGKVLSEMVQEQKPSADIGKLGLK